MSIKNYRIFYNINCMGIEFKEILKEFLSENNLTQVEFAKRIGVKQGQVSEWLYGKSKPGYDTLRAMAQAFNITADYFLGLTDEY
ncbi:MAG: helix-turn-helix transcriptional regulator [Clostridiales bacterium]|nr:helix-turn-helix transcriptional regulator [Clostridiales bacterium]